MRGAVGSAHEDARLVERTVGRKRLELAALATDVRAKLSVQAMQRVSHILQRLSEMLSRCQAHARYFDEPRLNPCRHTTRYCARTETALRQRKTTR